MKKLFFTICFMLSISLIFGAKADVIPLVGNAPQKPKSNLLPPNTPPSGMPNPQNQEEVRNFFKKRFEEAARIEMDSKTDWENAVGISVLHTPEYYKAKAEKEKPLFQKIYEKALESIHQEDAKQKQQLEDEREIQNDRKIAESATRFFIMSQDEDEEQTELPSLPTVSFNLPSGRRILAPAREHIPYFLSYVDIQANGYLKIEDTVVVVSNNNKFAESLTRMFPKYTSDGHRVELILESVVINDTPVPYVVEEVGSKIVIKPKFNHKLEPGVYTYKFNYLVNNKLVVENNNVLLNWSILGTPLNAFITSANAIISLPIGHSFENAMAIVGRDDRYTEQRTNIFQLDSNVLAFSNFTPMFNGENMILVAEMNKSIFLKGFNTKLSNLLIDWGSVIYASLGLLAIVISYLLSLFSLKKERKNNKYTPSYNGSLMRSIMVGKYDRTAFVSQLLDLYRKKAVELQEKDNRLFITYRDTETNKLSKIEAKALKILFPKKSTSMEINNTNNLLIKKVNRLFEKSVLKQIKKYRLIHNISYIIFSTLMIFATITAIAFISTNFAQSFIILISTALLYAFYVWILRHRFKKWYFALPTKLFALTSLFVIWAFSSIYTGGTTSFLLLLMVVAIFAFTGIFNEQNNFINEAKESIDKYKEYLIGNSEAINLSKDFLNQQSNIFALDIMEYFPQNISNKSFYKLEFAETLKQRLIDIL